MTHKACPAALQGLLDLVQVQVPGPDYGLLTAERQEQINKARGLIQVECATSCHQREGVV